MTSLAYTRNYVTQAHLRAAYESLGHTSHDRTWEATLLITPELYLRWACPVLAPAPEPYPETESDPDIEPAGWDTFDAPLVDWYVIAEAGELDWPPLRPEEEIWPALLAEHPVPTGEHAEKQARMRGKSIEEMHRDHLRRQYLSDAHIVGGKRHKGDVNFSPLVRDWSVTARELADFIDTHRPPKLSSEQRVMAQGARRAQLIAELDNTTASLGHLMRNAARDQGPKLRRGFKADMVRWTGVTRPTVDAWLNSGGCCEGTVPDENGTPHPGHTHTPDEAKAGEQPA